MADLAPHRTSDPRVVGSNPTNVVLARSEKVMLVPVVVRVYPAESPFCLEHIYSLFVSINTHLLA